MDEATEVTETLFVCLVQKLKKKLDLSNISEYLIRLSNKIMCHTAVQKITNFIILTLNRALQSFNVRRILVVTK